VYGGPKPEVTVELCDDGLNPEVAGELWDDRPKNPRKSKSRTRTSRTLR